MSNHSVAQPQLQIPLYQDRILSREPALANLRQVLRRQVLRQKVVRREGLGRQGLRGGSLRQESLQEQRLLGRIQQVVLHLPT